jgi:hypothetical protein
MDFEKDIREHVLANLPHDPGQEQELAALDAFELLIIFRNWQNRFVRVQPWRVHRSAALTTNPFSTDPTYQPALEQIVEILSKGQDVTPHLSRGVRHAYQSANTNQIPLGRRQDLDLLLNDWGVHHLHLSTRLGADGFVKRTEHLLFATFGSQDAYLIDIMKHGDWTREHVLEVMIKEWPEAGLAHELKGVVRLAARTTEAEREMLRNSGINSPFEFEGKFYIPKKGLTSAGTSVPMTMEVNRVAHSIRWFRNELDKDPDYVSKTLARHGLTPPVKPDLHFVFFYEGGYGVHEVQTGFRFRLSPSK